MLTLLLFGLVVAGLGYGAVVSWAAFKDWTRR